VLLFLKEIEVALADVVAGHHGETRTVMNATER
jgi:hypothetical protein